MENGLKSIQLQRRRRWQTSILCFQKQFRELFHPEDNPGVILDLMEPAKSKKAGLYPDLPVTLTGGKRITGDLLLIRTDLGDELNYSIVLL